MNQLVDDIRAALKNKEWLRPSEVASGAQDVQESRGPKAILQHIALYIFRGPHGKYFAYGYLKDDVHVQLEALVRQGVLEDRQDPEFPEIRQYRLKPKL